MNKSMHTSLACLVAGLALFGCSKKKDDAPAAKPDEVAVKPGIAPIHIEPEVAQALGTDVHGMVNKLAQEAQHRPKAGVLAEQVFDALDKVGVVIQQRTQYFGSIIQASFCAGGKTATELSLSVCEYPDEKSAEAGLASMNKHFNFAEVTRAVHKAAVITVNDPGHKEPDVVKKTIDTFLAL